MSREDGEVVRQPISVTGAPALRFEEQLVVHVPGLYALFNRAALRLPPRSRLRQALLGRAVRLGIEAVNRQDFDAACGLHDSRVELLVPPALAGMGFDSVVHGREERVRFEAKWRADWGDFSYAPES